MRTHPIIRIVACGTLGLVAVGGMACSKSAAAFESPYCDNIRSFVTYQGGGEGVAEQKAWWTEYLAFMDRGLATAPKSIHADWVVYHAGVAPQKAILEKYGYDEQSFDKSATDAEKAAMNIEGTNPKVGDAETNVKTYEAFNCGTGQPPDAKVTFKGDKASAYCDVIRADNEADDSIDFLDQASVRAALTGRENKRQAAASDARLIATAPKVIKNDVKAEVTWWNTKQKPVQAKYGYDMVKLIKNGSATELAALNLTDKKIAKHYARATAYEHQVCGA